MNSKKRNGNNRQILLLSVSCLLISSFSHAARFTPLGDFQGNSFRSIAFGISGDGSTIVGIGQAPVGDVSFRWSEDEEILRRSPNLPASKIGHQSFSTSSIAFDASEDGSAIVGSAYSDIGTQAFRWNKDIGIEGLGMLPFLTSFSQAHAVSSNGRTIVGWSGGHDRQAFVWRENSGMISLGTLGKSPDFGNYSAAYGVSSDGAIIVGETSTPNGIEAFRWTEETGMLGIGDFPGGRNQSEANDISADGSTIVGFASPVEKRWVAFRWTEELQLSSLGTLAGHAGSEAYAVSGDGSVIVGASFQELPVIEHQEAFIWKVNTGMLSLKSALIDAGLDLTNWELLEAYGVSDDGTRIVGSGINPDGNREAWLAVLPVPEPSSILLAFIATSISMIPFRCRTS